MSNPSGTRKTLIFGWILRANSSNTRCWYCISVPNFAAWNRRSPSQTTVASRNGARRPGIVQEGDRVGLRATR